MEPDNVDKLSPVVFIPHGAGPLPLLGDKSHLEMIGFLQDIATREKNTCYRCMFVPVSPNRRQNLFSRVMWPEKRLTPCYGNRLARLLSSLFK